MSAVSHRSSPQIEDGAALYQFEDISDRADGMILSRGNLGLDLALEKMARVQKAFIAACNLMVGDPPFFICFVKLAVLLEEP